MVSARREARARSRTLLLLLRSVIKDKRLKKAETRSNDIDSIRVLEDVHTLISFVRTMGAALDLELDLRMAAPYREQLKGALERLHKIEQYTLYQTVLKDFLDEERWRPLATQPKEFNKALANSLNDLRRFMRTKYGIKASRPTKNALRDARIFVLHKEGLPFPEIAKRFCIPTAAAHLGFQRHEERACRFYEALDQMMNLAKAHPWLTTEPPRDLPDLP